MSETITIPSPEQLEYSLPPGNIPIQWAYSPTEFDIREKAIQYTLQIFGDQDVEVEVFCPMLDSIYEFLKNGTPINIKLLTNNPND